jgi:LysR family transcriptional regulator, glycine cleavage system transcriptional activator
LKTRRRLPNLNALEAFELVAQSESLRKAADEAGMSIGSLSRFIKILEDHLETRLFIRSAKGVSLTESGNELLLHVRGAFDQLDFAISRMRKDESSDGVLSIWTHPTLANEWLIPRFGIIKARFPQHHIELTTSLARPPQLEHQFDMAIVEEHSNTKFTVVPLFEELLVPVCSPSLKYSPAELQSLPLSKLPLIFTRSRTGEWLRWIAEHRKDSEAITPTFLFDRTTYAIKAALDGLGVALVPQAFVETPLKRGSLFQPFGSKAITGATVEALIFATGRKLSIAKDLATFLADAPLD